MTARMSWFVVTLSGVVGLFCQAIRGFHQYQANTQPFPKFTYHACKRSFTKHSYLSCQQWQQLVEHPALDSNQV